MNNKKIYVFASKGISFTSKVIKFWQFNFPYTHVGIVYDLNNYINPFIVEMWYNGLNTSLFYNNHTKGTHFAVYSVNVTNGQYNKFKDELYKIIQLKPKYDWLGILGFPLRNKNIESKDRFFCSELVFYLFQKIGVNLLINTKPSEVSPRLFLKSPLLQFEYYCDGKEILDKEF